MKKKTGKIYGLFPVWFDEFGESHMKDCFINNYFIWLFQIMNEIDALACLCLGKPHYFIIKLDKEKEEE